MKMSTENGTPLRGWSDRPAAGGRTDFYRNSEIVASLTGPGATEVARRIRAVEAERDDLQAEVARLREALTRTVAFVDATADVLAGFGATTSTVTKLREVAAEARAALAKP